MSKRKTLLIIDNDCELVTAAKLRLEFDRGYRVLSTTNGTQGIELAIESQPDVIVLGNCVHRISDLSLLDFIRNHDQTHHIPVISLVGSEYQAIGLGWAFAYLVKPFAGTQLVHLVDQAIEFLRSNSSRQIVDIRIESPHQELTAILKSETRSRGKEAGCQA